MVKYVRYGKEWRNEVMKNKKDVIIDMLLRVAKERDELYAAQHSVQADTPKRCGECGRECEIICTHCYRVE